MITDLEQIKQLTIQRHDEFDVMRYMLQLNDDLSETAVDNWVTQLAAPIIEAIDCTLCANCCRSLDVYLLETDALRLATGIHISIEDITDRHIEQEEANELGEWGKFSQKPCVFLKGKLCSVYEHRPDTCRTYPQFTPDFRWVLEDLIEGAALCPIIYNVLSTVSEQIDDFIKDS